MLLIRICITAAFAALITFIFVTHGYWLVPNHDSATYVVEAQRLLAGGHFYDDIMETNPPLIVLLTAPGIIVGQTTGLDPWTGFTAWMCFLIVVSLVVATPYLQWAYAGKPAGSVLPALVYLVAIALLPAYSFAQRENLTIVLFLPSLLWFAARESGRPSPSDFRCIIALILAGVGLLIKPFFLAVLAILVVVRAIRHRNWRMLFGIETVTVLLAGLLYAAIVYAFFREWLGSAILATQVYFAFEESWRSVLRAVLPIGLTLAVASIVLETMPMDRKHRIFLRQLAIAAAGFLAMAILQRKGWSYQILPTRDLTFLLVALLGLELFAFMQMNRPLGKATLSGLLTLLCVIGLFVKPMLSYYLASSSWNGQFLAMPFARTVRQLAADRQWLALSTDVSPAFPTALLVGGQWSSRSPHQWMIPGIVSLNKGGEEDRARAKKLQQLATRFVTEDLIRYQPVMVAVRTGEHWAIVGPFEFLSFFSEDEDFRRAWSPYHLAKSVDGWEFYVRTAPVPIPLTAVRDGVVR